MGPLVNSCENVGSKETLISFVGETWLVCEGEEDAHNQTADMRHLQVMEQAEAEVKKCLISPRNGLHNSVSVLTD